MTARRLVLWRHGRTRWNHEDRFQGQSDIPLDETGLAQAKAAAAKLVKQRPAAIVASDLTRTTQTAAELAELTGLEVSYDADLREIDVGSWAGLKVADINAQYAGLREKLELDPDFRRGGDGETLAEVAERAGKALRRAIDLVPDGETVVVVGHGLSGRLGVAQLLGLPTQHWRIFGAMRNCGWLTLDCRHEIWRITGWNLH